MFRFLKLPTAPIIVVFGLLLLNAGCADTRVAIGQAYVAPAVLHLHSELTAKSTTAGDLKHGDHVEIMDVQRRMVRVRADNGVEGWTDSQNLLSPEQMDLLKKRREQEAELPSEGTATAYEALNVHLDPERQSPAFAQIPEGGAVSVLGHKVVAKNSSAPRTPGLVVTRPQVANSRKQRKEQQARSTSFRLPPRPAAPKPPANWQELSAERIDGSESETKGAQSKPVRGKSASVPAGHLAAPVKPAPPTKPEVLEDWTLIRTKNKEVGWVLTRNLLMSIPDEVAQYAEGKQITAFFELGIVNDDLKGQKHNWLWTTGAHALPYDFDSWRVFLWNNHRHRYETSFRQRELEGYFPVHVEAPEAGSPLRTFELIMKDEDGKMRRRTYTFDGHLVHLANTEDYGAARDVGNGTATAIDTQGLAAKAAKPNWFKRTWANVRRSFGGN